VIRAFIVLALTGCGRIAFDPVGRLDDATSGDARGDGELPLACGDGICNGNGGELCRSCASDCNTLTAVCGNGPCEAGESPACVADCGPSPWPWAAEGNALVTAINNARTTGFDCPGPGGVQTAPALAYDVTLEPEARLWAWEMAHHLIGLGDSCNGRSNSERFVAAGATVGWIAFADGASPAGAVSEWLANNASCPSIMNATLTVIGAGVAYDSTNGFAIFLK